MVGGDDLWASAQHGVQADFLLLASQRAVCRAAGLLSSGPPLFPSPVL